MKIAHRSISRILSSFNKKRHYKSLKNIFKHHNKPINFLYRYLTGNGSYPKKFFVKTPTKNISALGYHYHDLLTINEVFFRNDYFANDEINCILDLGGNIGLASLYFLSRNEKCKAYIYEPVESNLTKLMKNLKMNAFDKRAVIHPFAVSNFTGQTSFGIEDTGRYGGIGLNLTKKICVKCLHINEVLEKILSKENIIDILKIDTEGAELKTIQAIAKEFHPKINSIYAETSDLDMTKQDSFHIHQNGSISVYKNKKLS